MFNRGFNWVFTGSGAEQEQKFAPTNEPDELTTKRQQQRPVPAKPIRGSQRHLVAPVASDASKPFQVHSPEDGKAGTGPNGCEVPLIGYASRLSARPGDKLEFKVSSVAAAPYEAKLVRVICADANPSGPGLIEEDVPSDFAGSYPSRFQTTHLGSYVHVHSPPGLMQSATQTGFTLCAMIQPTAPDKEEQVIISSYDGGTRLGIALGILPEAGATALIGVGGSEPLISLSVGNPMLAHSWYRVWCSYNPETRTLKVGQDPVKPQFMQDDRGEASQKMQLELPLSTSDTILIGAMGTDASGEESIPRLFFNGKIESPAITECELALPGIVKALQGEVFMGVAARWDFSQCIDSNVVVDVGPHGLHGETVNMPRRGVTGAMWTGEEMCWRHCSRGYAAMHFHDDDLSDARWGTDFEWEVPAELPSGAYAVRLKCGDEEDSIPFFICPPKGTKRAELCVLFSTFTYMVYGNHARVDFGEKLQERMATWPGAYKYNPATHGRQYGLSTYNNHTDGSGIDTASRHRPLMTLKCGFISIAEAEEGGSGVRHFQADTHLLAWLHKQGISYDVLTDDELSAEGVEALAPYRCVCTGTHPEYHTGGMLDALQGYKAQGGRLVYLGGNGFYWRIALHQDLEGILEIRRAEGGIRAWAAQPGEYYNAFDGGYGGLWRRNGRAPQTVAGVGFSAQGTFGKAGFYRIAPDVREDERTAWIFKHVTDDTLGDTGLCAGGAAGFELDRVDTRLGTPAHAVIVASSEGHGDNYVLVPEEQLTHVTTEPGLSHADLIKADMVYYETPEGGAVFSVGAITFCGSLPINNFSNSASTVLYNVLTCFTAP
ncbi:hypothetical protein CYMTET_3912 [Cymbomonas tetramitiformis]|uniref:N,N-dimethylformamidase beta subunit-like C-terminal domain-containing protein n=1 Tax=Cymbomonas tetramitiformis TaxID=36881 RepID=A0AAE0H2F5_9CHLO|nr:hypothetical protein CYMTET_3912 [Cymbomonas tetramitiformis]